MSFLPLALRWWREALIVALVLIVMAGCHARDNSIAEKARAELVYRQADSTIRALAPKLARADTLVVRDTVVVRRTIARLDTLRDTLLKNVHDTALVIQYVTRADSAAKACGELSSDCSAFRSFALQRMTQDSIKLHAQPMVIAKSCTTPSVVSGIIGLAAGYALHR